MDRHASSEKSKKKKKNVRKGTRKREQRRGSGNLGDGPRRRPSSGVTSRLQIDEPRTIYEGP